jgi:hypothetical protein
MKPSRRRADSTEITCRWCNGRLWGLSRSLAARYLMARSPAAIEEFGGQAVVLKLMVSMMTARVKLGGAHRPVGEAGGGGAAYLEQGGRGAGGPLPRDPGGWLVKAALIGTKQIAPQHLTCPESPAGVELRAICDLSPATTEAHRVAGAPLCGPHRTGPPRRSGLSARPRTSSTSRASASGGATSPITCAAGASRAGACPSPTGTLSGWWGWPPPPSSGAPPRCPASSSHVGSSRGSNRSASRTAGCQTKPVAPSPN